MKAKILIVVIFLSLMLTIDLQAGSLALSARAFYSGVYSQSLGNVFKLDTFNSAYGFELDADIFLVEKFSLGAVLHRSFVGTYQQYYTGYGLSMKFWRRSHYWGIGASYFTKNASVIDNMGSPENLVLTKFSLGLYGGSGINWLFEIPVQAGMELNSQVFYGDIGIQGGLLFNL